MFHLKLWINFLSLSIAGSNWLARLGRNMQDRLTLRWSQADLQLHQADPSDLPCVDAFLCRRSSSIRGSKNTSKSFPREVGPRISRDIKQFDGFTHSHGGRFRGITRIGHILYVELKLPNGLKPSVAMASLKFLGSSAKVGCFLSKS